MKTIKKETVAKAQRLNEVRELLKQFKKEEALLKADFEALMGNENMIEAGNIVITRKMVAGTKFDKKALTADMGSEFIAKYTVANPYSKLDITTINATTEVA